MTTDGRQKYLNRRAQRPSGKDPRAKWALVYLGRTCIIIACVVAYILWVQYRKNHAEPAPVYAHNELLYVILPENTKAQEIDYNGFHVSFNPDHHIPNYVVWQLTKAKAAGKGKRESQFDVDPNVQGCATLEDYRRSGYDRGHMAPAGDMKWSDLSMTQCHYLTNIVPQNHELNKGVWNAIEQKSREWVEVEDSLIIITGPVLTDDNLEKIGHSGVTVPRRFFKIILAPNSDPLMALAFMVDNRDVEHNYEWYTASIDQIEEATGMDFFSSLPKDVENKIECSRGLGAWKNHIKIKERERNIQ